MGFLFLFLLMMTMVTTATPTKGTVLKKAQCPPLTPYIIIIMSELYIVIVLITYLLDCIQVHTHARLDTPAACARMQAHMRGCTRSPPPHTHRRHTHTHTDMQIQTQTARTHIITHACLPQAPVLLDYMRTWLGTAVWYSICDIQADSGRCTQASKLE